MNIMIGRDRGSRGAASVRVATCMSGIRVGPTGDVDDAFQTNRCDA